MPLLNYTLTAIITNAGIILGIILAYIAEEEIKPGKNYFIIMKNIIITMILAATMLMFTSNIILISIISVLAIALLFYIDYFIIGFNIKSKTDKKKAKKECITRITTYTLLGIAFYLSSKNIPYFIAVSSLIFFYGFPSGSLAISLKNANKWKIILTSGSFFIITMLIYIIA